MHTVENINAFASQPVAANHPQYAFLHDAAEQAVRFAGKDVSQHCPIVDLWELSS